MTGNGQPRIWGTGSQLSGFVRRNANYQSFFRTTKRFIWEGLQREGLNTTRTRYTFYFHSPDFGWPTFGDALVTTISWIFHYQDSGAPLRCVIGGISGWKIFARNLIVHSARRVTLQLRFEICDHFGADNSDHYESGIICLWLLQHAKPGPQRPFCNLIAVEEDCELTP